MGNRLALGTERTKLVCGDDQSVISFRICWPRSSKTSKSSVRSSRSRRKYIFFNLGESTIKRAKRYIHVVSSSGYLFWPQHSLDAKGFGKSTKVIDPKVRKCYKLVQIVVY